MTVEERAREVLRHFFVMPAWLQSVEDQYVALGSALIYQLDLPIDDYGRMMILEVDLGQASEFASFIE